MSGPGDAALEPSDLRRFAAFVVVGMVNTAVGYGLYAGFVWLGLGPQPALALSFVLGVLWNYVAHARFVFRTRGFDRLPFYVGVYAGIYVVNALVLAGLLRLGLGPIVAQALILPFAVVATYLGVGVALTGRLPIASRRPSDRRG